MEPGGLRAVRRHDRGRRFNADAQCPRRISADRRLSPVGGFGHERSVAGIRHFLADPQAPPSGMAGITAHHRTFRLLCLYCRHGCADYESCAHVGTVSGGAPSLSRPQRTECHWLRRARGACAFSCGPFRRQLPIDLSRALSHHGHLPAHFGAELYTVSLRAAPP